MKNNICILLIACTTLFSCTKEPDQQTTEPPVSSSLNQGLLLHLPFNNSLADSSGLGNNGTAFGNISYGSNRYFEGSRVLALSGSNNRVEIPGAKFDTLSNFTLYLEFMPANTNSMVLFSRAIFTPSANPGQSFNMMINHSGGGTRFQMKKPGNCDNTNTVTAFGNAVIGQAIPSINAWNYMAVTYNGITISTYLNGKLVGTDVQPGLNLCSNAPLLIGSWWEGDPYFFNGSIDEVRVYNRALPSAEIAQLFQLHK